MSLTEALVASTVLAVTSSASAALMGLALTAEQHRAGHAEALRAMDGALRQAQLAMTDLASLPESRCDWVSETLQQRIAAQPVPEGLRRRLQLSADGERLRLQLGDAAGRERVRLIDPAAHGHCGREESDAPA